MKQNHLFLHKMSIVTFVIVFLKKTESTNFLKTTSNQMKSC